MKTLDNNKSNESSQPGVLFAVVGKSGVGKDTIIEAARQRLANDKKFHFPKRIITRKSDAGGEDHIEISEADFKQESEQGAYSLSWQAHGLYYGIPVEIETRLQSGQSIIVNISRRAVPQAKLKFPHFEVIEITASPATIRQRLNQRGRETEVEIEKRATRNIETDWSENVSHSIVHNDTTIDAAAAAFVEKLISHQGHIGQ